MATDGHVSTRSDDSSKEVEVPRDSRNLEEHSPSTHTDGNNHEEKENVDNLEYPKPWKFEKWFVGGYTQNRMLKFKKPKSMYTAINLFAGELSMEAELT